MTTLPPHRPTWAPVPMKEHTHTDNPACHASTTASGPIEGKDYSKGDIDKNARRKTTN